MRIPQFWVRETYTGVDPDGQEQSFLAWGWSFTSLAHAKEQAIARARTIFDAIVSGRKPDTYDYLENPLREEIVERVGPTGQETAIVTRNRYGSLVLNCQSVCFVDVDFPCVKASGLLDFVVSLFSAKRRQEKAHAVQQACIEKIRAWAKDNPQRSFRLYRTAAGLRLLFTDKTYDPVSDEVSSLLRQLGSDPLYRKLTLKQECFRARLTPKPWRCQCKRPPNRYPWQTPEAEELYRTWQRNYETRSEAYATCRLVETFGNSGRDGLFAGIVNLHDQLTCRDGNAALA